MNVLIAVVVMVVKKYQKCESKFYEDFFWREKVEKLDSKEVLNWEMQGKETNFEKFMVFGNKYLF